MMFLGLLATGKWRSTEKTTSQSHSNKKTGLKKPSSQKCDLYVWTASGDQMGPYTKVQLEQFLEKEIYGSQDFFTVAGWDTWQPMDQFQYYEEL